MDFALFNLKIAASRTVKLGGTVATVGFPDIGLQDFLTTKHTNYTKIKSRFILCPLSCISWLKSFPVLLAKLAGAADDRAISRSACRCSK